MNVSYLEVVAAEQAYQEAACIELGGAAEDRFFSAKTQIFLILNGMIVFFMQAGFACLEAGSIGSTAVTSVMFKNFVDAVVGGLCFFAVGYAFFNGRINNEFMGLSGFFLETVGQCEIAFAFFMFTFCQVTCTIVSGAVAGRTKLIAYIINTVVLSTIVWPLVAHWVWSQNAWLTRGTDGVGFVDYAGSGVVHVVGGVSAISMAFFVGPRGTPLFEKTVGRMAIPGHSMPLVAHGTIVLWFGFLAFNGGSIGRLDNINDITMATLAVMNTFLAPSAGALAAVALDQQISSEGFWSLTALTNGCIAGMVAICAGANQVQPWAACVIGAIGGVLYRLYSSLVSWLMIDDPVDAIAVHFGGGTWGVVAVALFSKDIGLFYNIDSDTAWKQLGWNLLGLLVITVFTAGIMFPTHYLLYKFRILRVDDEHINMGLDLVEHGEGAYHILSGNAALPMHARLHTRETRLRNRGGGQPTITSPENNEEVTNESNAVNTGPDDITEV